jgi:hypothetical protein
MHCTPPSGAISPRGTERKSGDPCKSSFANGCDYWGSNGSRLGSTIVPQVVVNDTHYSLLEYSLNQCIFTHTQTQTQTQTQTHIHTHTYIFNPLPPLYPPPHTSEDARMFAGYLMCACVCLSLSIETKWNVISNITS